MIKTLNPKKWLEKESKKNPPQKAEIKLHEGAKKIEKITKIKIRFNVIPKKLKYGIKLLCKRAIKYMIGARMAVFASILKIKNDECFV